MSYEDTLNYLYAATPAFHQVGAAAYKPGLQNTLELLEACGHPEHQLQCIHVAGTNGKGSTSHLIAAALQCAGYKTGLYTSPHLVDYRERIRVNGVMVDKAYVVDFVERYKTDIERIQPSFFEITMAMAFRYFADLQVDRVVVEVGLGGRLDSTNVIRPLLSVITNIGLDHVQFLGNTLPQIASEKAGIIKEQTTVVIGETHPETEPVFRQQAQQLQAPIIFADQQPQMPDLECELHGIYQQKNKQTAYVALQQLEVPFTAIAKGFARVCTLTGLQGRWQVIQESPLIICDTGHNSHGLKYVSEQLRNAKKKLHIVIGMVDDKDVSTVFEYLPSDATFYYTQAQTHRAIPAHDLMLIGVKAGCLHGTAFESIPAAIDAAQKQATRDDLIFIGGSNYVVGEALQLLNK